MIMRKYKDIEIGDKFGKWKVIDKCISKPSSNRKYWMCQCSCVYGTIKPVREDGLLNGTSKGCIKCANLTDLTDMEFGYLKVIGLNKEMSCLDNHTYYNVRCKCGKEYQVRSDTLLDGTTKSCGCKQLEYEDLTGQKFGKLTVLEFVYRFRYSEIKEYRASVNIWTCICECGNIVNKRQGDLISLHGCSCGCDIRSNGEKKICEVLKRWNINFIEQYRFNNCKYKNPLPFDFAILIKNQILCVIEYDGEYHYMPIKYKDLTDEEANENFYNTRLRDSIKDKYCSDNNIHLIRIPYWELENENIENIIFDNFIELGILEELNNVS